MDSTSQDETSFRYSLLPIRPLACALYESIPEWSGALTCVYLRDCLLRLCARVVCWLTALRAVNTTRFTASNWVMCLSHISWPPARRDGLTSYNRLSPPRIGFFTVRQRRSRTPLPLHDTLDASRCVALCYVCVCVCVLDRCARRFVRTSCTLCFHGEAIAAPSKKILCVQQASLATRFIGSLNAGLYL